MTFEFDVDFSKFGEYEYELDDNLMPARKLEDKRVLAKMAILEIDGYKYPIRASDKERMLKDIEFRLHEYYAQEDSRKDETPIYIIFRYVTPLKITLKPKKQNNNKQKP